MKTSHIAGGAAALTLAVALAGAAGAQQAAPGADARVSQAEFVDRRVTRLSAMDANRDGSVTPDEMRAGRQARMAERAAMRFDRMDADRNGSISRAEFDSAREARADRPQRMARDARRGERMGARQPVVIADVQTRAARVFARLDANSDGYVTVEERQAARATMRDHRQERRAERMARRAARMQASPPAPASE